MDLTLLADLLSQSEEKEEEKEAGQNPSFANPSAIGPSYHPQESSETQSIAGAGEEKKKKKKDSKSIWDDDEVEESGHDFKDDPLDPRIQPEYDIVYTQRVTTEDVYLGIDYEKDPGVGSSDGMIVKVQLPGAKASQMALDVGPSSMQLTTQKHKLTIPFPRRVKDKEGKAQWDGKTETLKITLPFAE
eukprot:TRINITY_DN2794_c0_g1_i1.p1 TRINITY_DN2794_c0_g1~~TRINITY_DN2794_c0_g1_i1.p1  ORF type:complete len:217 (-),score=72.61 TRINITY_DN2794_c0_g1_i1:67-630(-)